MKKTSLIITALLLAGCAPKINSIKSPINKIQPTKCFVMPSTNYLSKAPINEQMLYTLTGQSLKEHGYQAIYGSNGTCNNYIYTSWTVSTSKELVSSGGNTYTNNYGYIYSNLNYSLPYSYSGTSQTYTTPTSTYETTNYYGTYKLEVGVIKKGKVHKSWEATQAGQLASANIEEAEKVSNDDYHIISTMVKQMIQENFVSSSK